MGCLWGALNDDDDDDDDDEAALASSELHFAITSEQHGEYWYAPLGGVSRIYQFLNKSWGKKTLYLCRSELVEADDMDAIAAVCATRRVQPPRHEWPPDAAAPGYVVLPLLRLAVYFCCCL